MPITKTHLKLRRDAIEAAMTVKGIGSTSDLATLIGAGRTTFFDAMAGRTWASESIVAGLRLRLEIPWDFIVEVVEVRVDRKLAAA
ncbi:UNVERIFIED_ORG: hypothetical protein M2328_005716 [Rhodococcus erythropolis]